jgi:predicted aldo/keto reductase-like oxidoreductase
MIYKEFQGLKLSALGMGTVRLPITSENSADVNIPAVDKMVDAAIAQGVNYFDLGWDYHGCRAETIVSQSLLRYPRDSYYLATKFPGYYPDKLDKVEEIFEEQLRHCGVDYFDFYLLHNVCEANIDAYLDPKYGIIDYLLKQKEAGRIRHFGFSTHGEVENIRAFLDAAGQHMEFCQIQLNWLDWTFQRAKEKVALLRERNIPVWVMEPLRGGKILLKLAEEHVKRLQTLRPEETVYGWGLRFLQTIPEVTMTLSGFSSVEHVMENTKTFSEEKPLTPEEWDVLQSIAETLKQKSSVPCTACRYCVSHCPQQLNIPKLLEFYNEQSFSGGGFIAPRAMMALPEQQRATACIGCGSCEAFCPQNIKISGAMAALVQWAEEFFKPKA